MNKPPMRSQTTRRLAENPDPDALSSAQSFEMLRYFPMELGFSWTYNLPGILQTCLVRVARSQSILGGRARRVLVQEDNNAQAIYNIAPGYGVYWVSEMVAPQGWSLVPPEPMLMIPARLVDGGSHSGTSPCVRRGPSNEKLDYGTLSIASTLEAIEDATLPVGHFERCLRMNNRFSYTSDAGLIFAVESKMWLSEDLGAVKAHHAYVFEAFNEFEGHRWEINLELQEAKLGKKQVP